MTRVTPADTTARNAAAERADVLADREVEVVAAHAGAVLPRRVPELREARIEIEVRLPAEPSQQRFEREVAADVQQQVRRVSDVEQLAIRDTAGLGTAVADEGGRLRQPGLAHDVLEVGDVRALGEGHRLAAIVGAVLGRDLLDVIDAHAELAESVNPVQDRPRVPAVSALRRDHARHQDRRHPCTACARGWRTS